MSRLRSAPTATTADAIPFVHTTRRATVAGCASTAVTVPHGAPRTLPLLTAAATAAVLERPDRSADR